MTLNDVMIANSVQNEKSNKVHNRSSKKNLEVGAMGSEHPLLTGYNPGYIPLALFVIFGKTKKTVDKRLIIYGLTVSMNDVSQHSTQ